MSKLTAKQKKDYIKGGQNGCPYCGSDDIEGGFVEIDSGGAWQEVYCHICHKEWSDIYKMVDIEER